MFDRYNITSAADQREALERVAQAVSASTRHDGGGDEPPPIVSAS